MRNALLLLPYTLIGHAESLFTISAIKYVIVTIVNKFPFSRKGFSQYWYKIVTSAVTLQRRSAFNPLRTKILPWRRTHGWYFLEQKLRATSNLNFFLRYFVRTSSYLTRRNHRMQSLAIFQVAVPRRVLASNSTTPSRLSREEDQNAISKMKTQFVLRNGDSSTSKQHRSVIRPRLFPRDRKK